VVGARRAGAFLDRLGPADRAALLDAGRPRRYRAGETIFLTGERGGDVVLITGGRAKVTVASRHGTETVLSLRGRGDVIGELAAIDDDDTAPRGATVVALEAVDTRVVRSADFRAIVARRPSMALELLRMVAERLRASDRRLVEFGASDTTRRVARLLAEMAEADATPTDGGLLLASNLTQDDLAGLVGASRESVARALAALRARGFVATGRRQVVVLDLAGLRDHGR
jgi:CRP/FNR family transcriptional regulator, cyclic AMP receptor protein